MVSGPYPKFIQTFIWEIREELVLKKKVSSKGKSLLNQSISMYGKYFSLSSITMLLYCVSSHDSKILIDLKQVLLVENHDPAT